MLYLFLSAMVTVALERKDGGSAKNALELLRTVNGKAWESTATVFRQIDAVGSKSIKALAIHGIICKSYRYSGAVLMKLSTPQP